MYACVYTCVYPCVCVPVHVGMLDSLPVFCQSSLGLGSSW